MFQAEGRFVVGVQCVEVGTMVEGSFVEAVGVIDKADDIVAVAPGLGEVGEDAVVVGDHHS